MATVPVARNSGEVLHVTKLQATEAKTRESSSLSRTAIGLRVKVTPLEIAPSGAGLLRSTSGIDVRPGKGVSTCTCACMCGMRADVRAASFETLVVNG